MVFKGNWIYLVSNEEVEVNPEDRVGNVQKKADSQQDQIKEQTVISQTFRTAGGKTF